MTSHSYDSALVDGWLDGRMPLAARSWAGDGGQMPLPGSRGWPQYRLGEPGGEPRLPTALEALAETHLLAVLPRRVQRQIRAGTPVVVTITTPCADWSEAIDAAAHHLFRDAHAFAVSAPKRGALPPKAPSIDRPTIAVTSDDAWLSPALIAGADHRLQLGPDPRAVELAIAVICGRRARVTAADIAGLDATEMSFALRRGASSRSCVQILRALAAEKSRPAFRQTDRTPTLDLLVGYGSAIDKVRAVAADIALVKAGDLAPADLPSLLLYGPPGTGKTMLARSLAKSTGLLILETSVSAWFHGGDGHLGTVTKNAKTFFDEALAAAPCVAFLDEIDALPDRAALDARGREWWNTLVTGILLLIDKLRAAGTGVVLVAATNHIQHIDAALKRPGRFDRHIEILGPQTPDEIAEVLRHHLGADLVGVDLRAAAQLAHGGTGAAAEGWVRQAREAARCAGRPMTLADLTAAIAPSDTRPPAELRAVALHEAGHAVVGRALGLKVPTVTIVQEGIAAGTTLLEGLNGTLSRAQVEARAIAILAGRAADEMLAGGADAGAVVDLAQATQIVAMVHGSFGLGDRLTSAGVNAVAPQILADHRLRDVVEDDLQRLMEEARGLVRLHERAIRVLADLLVRQRVAAADDIDRALAADVEPGVDALIGRPA